MSVIFVSTSDQTVIYTINFFGGTSTFNFQHDLRYQSFYPQMETEPYDQGDK